MVDAPARTSPSRHPPGSCTGRILHWVPASDCAARLGAGELEPDAQPPAGRALSATCTQPESFCSISQDNRAATQPVRPGPVFFSLIDLNQHRSRGPTTPPLHPRRGIHLVACRLACCWSTWRAWQVWARGRTPLRLRAFSSQSSLRERRGQHNSRPSTRFTARSLAMAPFPGIQQPLKAPQRCRQFVGCAIVLANESCI